MLKNTKQSSAPWISLKNVTQCALVFFWSEAKLSLHTRCHYCSHISFSSRPTPASLAICAGGIKHDVEYRQAFGEAVNDLPKQWDINRGGGQEMIDEYNSDSEEEDTGSSYSSDEDRNVPSPYPNDHPNSRPSYNGSRTKVSDSSNQVPSSSAAMFLGNTLKSVASKTLDMATTSIGGTVDIVSPKHVSRNEIVGLWRLDQQVGLLPNQPHISCAATIQLFWNGTAMTYYKDKTYTTVYKFTERSWPRSCTIELDAFAFQGPSDKEPIKLFYKGTLRRKLLKSSIIQITGKIYEEEELRWRLRRTVQLKQIGTFTGRRRVTILPPPREEQVYDNNAADEDETEDGDVDHDNGSDVTNDGYDYDAYNDDDEDDAILNSSFDEFDKQADTEPTP